MDRQTQQLMKKSMSKRGLREYHKAQRVVNSMNTGTRTHKTAKDYNRRESKREVRKMLKEC